MFTRDFEQQRTATHFGEFHPAWVAVADADVNHSNQECPHLATIDRMGSEDRLVRIIEGKTTEQLAVAIVALPEKERLILALYYFEELTTKEIGRALDLSNAKVSKILTSALSCLREILHAQPA